MGRPPRAAQRIHEDRAAEVRTGAERTGERSHERALSLPGEWVMRARQAVSDNCGGTRVLHS